MNRVNNCIQQVLILYVFFNKTPASSVKFEFTHLNSNIMAIYKDSTENNEIISRYDCAFSNIKFKLV